MHRTSLALLTLALTAALGGCGIPRTDVLECALPDGSRFVLKAPYDWYPLAKFLRSAAERLNQERYRIYYQPDQRTPPQLVSSMSYRYIGSKRYRIETCARFGLWGGVIYADQDVLLPGSRQFQRVNFSQVLRIPDPHKYSDADRTLVERLNLSPSQYLAYGITDGQFVAEAALLGLIAQPCREAGRSVYCPIMAVWQAISPDGGQTWPPPVLTQAAKLFVIGKGIAEQPHVAKPHRYKLVTELWGWHTEARRWEWPREDRNARLAGAQARRRSQTVQHHSLNTVRRRSTPCTGTQ